MKIEDYIAALQTLAQKHPGAVVIYSSDDEGNHYSPVHFHPSAGRFNGGEWIPDDMTKKFKANAVCLN